MGDNYSYQDIKINQTEHTPKSNYAEFEHGTVSPDVAVQIRRKIESKKGRPGGRASSVMRANSSQQKMFMSFQ